MDERERVARRADRIAYRLLTEDHQPWARRQAVAELRAANRERDVLDQQQAWNSRATGWAVPAMPAWQD